jgi:hypothetical protein
VPTYSIPEMARINAQARPLPEVERLAREVPDDPEQVDALIEEIVSERPYIGPSSARDIIALANGLPGK